MKKELSIFIEFEESYGKNKIGAKYAAPCKVINIRGLKSKSLQMND